MTTHPRPGTADPRSEVPDILRRIVEQRRRRLAAAGDQTMPLPVGKRLPNPFLAALKKNRGRAVIAEVKMGSPKLGDLRQRVDPVAQAKLYAESGASALSVVVEPDFFYGSYDLLQKCRQESGLPTLAKDFIVDDLQLYWAAAAGATAVLLIAALYTERELLRLAVRARGLGMVPLIEVHHRSDLGKLGADEPWELVGINNRNLSTFEVDLEHSIGLVSSLPPRSMRVAESGIRTNDDVKKLRAAGFGAFLVGESLLLSEDPAATLKELLA